MKSIKEIEEDVRRCVAGMSDRELLEEIYVEIMVKKSMTAEFEMKNLKMKRDAILATPSMVHITQPIHY